MLLGVYLRGCFCLSNLVASLFDRKREISCLVSVPVTETDPKTYRTSEENENEKHAKILTLHCEITSLKTFNPC